MSEIKVPALLVPGDNLGPSGKIANVSSVEGAATQAAVDGLSQSVNAALIALTDISVCAGRGDAGVVPSTSQRRSHRWESAVGNFVPRLLVARSGALTGAFDLRILDATGVQLATQSISATDLVNPGEYYPMQTGGVPTQRDVPFFVELVFGAGVGPAPVNGQEQSTIYYEMWSGTGLDPS